MIFICKQNDKLFIKIRLDKTGAIIYNILNLNKMQGGIMLDRKTIKEWCLENSGKYTDKKDLIAACIKALGVTRDRVIRKLKAIDNVATGVAGAGLSESELRARCDVTFKIEQAVKSLPEGRFIPDSEFREMICKINANAFRSKADQSQFDKNKGVAGGVVYWAKAEDIKRLKESGVLQ
jgi:hypothetical protein